MIIIICLIFNLYEDKLPFRLNKKENFTDSKDWKKMKQKYIQILLNNNIGLEQKIMDGSLPYDKLQYINARIEFIKNIDYLLKENN
jgi:hypothetical protein